MTIRPIPPELAPGDDHFPIEAVDLAVVPNPPVENDYDESYASQERRNDLADRVRRWQVTDDGAAEWAMRHVAAIDRESAAIEEQFALWLEPIVAWRDAELDRLHPRRAFFESHLRAYGLQVRAADPKRATISLPSGKIATRAPSAPTVQVENEEKVIEWAAAGLTDEEYAQVIRTTQKVLVSEIRKLVAVDSREMRERNGLGEDVREPWTEHQVIWKATGEVIPGLVAEMSDMTATVTPAP